jgi:hypothetical protein
MREDVTFTKYDINEMERAIDKMIDSFETIEHYASLINSGRYLSPEFLGDTSRLLDRGAGYEAAFPYDRGNVFDILEEMVNNNSNDE